MELPNSIPSCLVIKNSCFWENAPFVRKKYLCLLDYGIMRQIRVFVEKGKDGQFSAYMLDNNNLPFGLISMGKTLQESKEDILSSYSEMKNLLVAEGNVFNE